MAVNMPKDLEEDAERVLAQTLARILGFERTLEAIYNNQEIPDDTIRAAPANNKERIHPRPSRIRLSLYLPQAWAGRAGTFLDLGYGELAAADAYRCRLLGEAISMEAYQAWKEDDGSLTSKVVEAMVSKSPQCDLDFDVLENEIRVTEERAWLIMAQGLMCVRAWYDAILVLEDGLKRYPSNFMFKYLLATLKLDFEQLKKDFRAQSGDSASIQKTIKRGRVDHVAYPWLVAEELTRSNKAIKKVKAKLDAATTRAGIAPSDLGDNTDGNYGVFAKGDINKGERILLDKSIYSYFNILDVNDCSACSQPLHGSDVTLNYYKAKFYTEPCKVEALNAYHRILYGKDFGWLYAACKDTDDIFHEMIPLHMVNVFATVIQQNAKSLKLACVGTLQADYQQQVLSYVRLLDNIIAPIKVLQILGVDIFTDMRFDSWALQTLFMRIENHKQGGKFGDRRHSGINTLSSMFNHDCNPGATWHSIEGGGAIEVVAIRDIKKDEEIYVSYVEPCVPEAERRQKISAQIAKMCECRRCVQEREAAVNRREVDAIDVAKMRRDILYAQIGSRVRLAKEH